MATNPFSPPSISGYNSNPPPDDGTQVTANKAKWQDILDKLAGPLKTFAEAIVSAITTMGGKLINTDDDENNSMGGSLAFTSSELTIASGAITPTRTAHTVDTESDASTDDLDTITATNVGTGAFLILRAENGGRTVVVKNGTGNIILTGGTDYSLDDASRTITLYYDGTNWLEITRSARTGLLQPPVRTEVATSSTVANAQIPCDGTTPQNTEGTNVDAFDTAITPVSAESVLEVQVGVWLGEATNIEDELVVALFRDSDADAIAVGLIGGRVSSIFGAGLSYGYTTFTAEVPSNSASETTFKIRVGSDGANAGNLRINGVSGTNFFGTAAVSFVSVKEYSA